MEYELIVPNNSQNRRYTLALLGMFTGIWAKFITNAEDIQFATDSAATYSATAAVFEEWPE
jgi:hypothetical protein